MITLLLEAVAGSREKHSFDEESLEHRGFGETLLPYPYPYGFILGTRTEEGDGVDCYLLSRREYRPGDRIECEPLGMLEFFEGEELDHKVLAALPGESPPLDEALRGELERFIYGIFRRFPEMKVKVGSLGSQAEAEEFIERFRIR